MIEEDKNIESGTGPVVEPDEIIPASRSIRSDRFAGNNRSRIHVAKLETDRFTIVPVLFGSMIGILIGGLIGAFVGFLVGPFGMVAGIGIGVLSGFFLGAVMGSVMWMLIPKIIRSLLVAGMTLLILQWIVAKYFNISLWHKLTQILPF